MKMSHFSNLGVTEVFLEATPTTFITTVLFVLTVNSGGLWPERRPFPSQFQDILWGNGKRGSASGLGTVLFLIGYSASILSSAFGVSR